MKHLIVIGLLTFILSNCHQDVEEHVEHEKIPLLEASTPLIRDTVLSREYVCQIHASKRIELKALERGYLQKIFVDEGQYIHKGNDMFKIMPNVYEADLQKMKAEAEVADIEYQSTKMLFEKDVVSEIELALSKAHLDKAKAEIQLAETHLGFTNIQAPFSGIMNHLHAREGSLLEEGELLTTLSDIDRMWVYFNVPEAEYLEFVSQKKNQNQKVVSLQLANGKIFGHEGIIETIEGEFNNETGNIEFRAGFPNPERILRHGQTGNIIMHTPYKKAMMIPQKATFEVLDKKYVYVINEDQRLERRKIVIEEELPHLYIIKDGLKESDLVLLEGLRRVKDGQEIEIDLQSSGQVLASIDLQAE